MAEQNSSAAAAPRLLHDIEEARQLLGGLGRSTLYKAIQEGRLRPVKVGARTFLPRAEIERFANSLAAA